MSLALGIGANTAIFSVVDSLVLRSVPVSEPQRLFMLSTSVAGANRPQFSYSTLKQIRTRGDLFDGVMGYTSRCGESIVIQAGARQGRSPIRHPRFLHHARRPRVSRTPVDAGR